MYHGNHAAMSALLAAGADPNQQRETDENWSPLVSAVENTERYRNFFLYDTMNGGKSRCSSYILPSLLRAGASINHPGITRLFRALNDPDRSLRPAQRKPVEYLQAVQAAGGFPAYARAHRSRFAAIFSRGTRLPVDVIPTIGYWFNWAAVVLTLFSGFDGSPTSKFIHRRLYPHDQNPPPTLCKEE